MVSHICYVISVLHWLYSVIISNNLLSNHLMQYDGCWYLLIMTPDTASSRAAMRAEVPTDRPSARWERGGGGGSVFTSARQGETAVLYSCYLPQRSINILFSTLIPNLINDVKAMTQQSLAGETAGACQFLFSGEGRSHFTCLSRGTNLHTEEDHIESVTFYDLATQNYLLLVITENTFANHKARRDCRSLRYYWDGNSPVILLEIIKWHSITLIYFRSTFINVLFIWGY